jgi:hypothetical protein
MALLTREQILGVDDSVIETVTVPEWGGEVGVKTLSGAEKDGWESDRQGKDGEFNLENIRASLVAVAACDAKGVRLFTLKDVVDLGKKSAKALDRVFQAAKKLNGVTDEELDEIEGES